MKKTFGCRFLTLIMAILAIMAAGCGKSDEKSVENEVWNKLPDHIGDYYVSTAPLDSLLTTEYELASLVAFFPEHDLYDQHIFLDYEEEPEIRIEDVDRAFPLEVLRKSHGCYYTVYKVKEGGLFYVFFLPSSDDGKPGNYNFVSGEVAYTRHITAPMSRSSFYGIRPGKSTAQDVKEIDPNVELCLVLSSGVFSYSFLEGNKYLRITYKGSDYVDSNPTHLPRNPSDYIVEKIEVIKILEMGFHLGAILPQDLPWNQYTYGPGDGAVSQSDGQSDKQ